MKLLKKEASRKSAHYHNLLRKCANGRKIRSNDFTIFIGDISDYIKMYELILNEKYKLAYKLFWKMDTSARDYSLSNIAYTQLTKLAGTNE